MEYLGINKVELEDELGLTWLKGMIKNLGDSATSSLVGQQVGLADIDTTVNMVAEFMRKVTGDDYEVLDFTQVNAKQQKPTTNKPTGL